MENLLHHPGSLWLAASVCFMLMEAFGMPGAGMLFAGAGALLAGLAVFLGLVGAEDVAFQFTLFFAFSLAAALLLWKPMQRFRVGRRHGEYHNIIGGVAYVGSNGLSRTHGGEVTWSGTIMRAELARSAGVEALEAGAPVVITEVSGATLIVKPQE